MSSAKKIAILFKPQCVSLCLASRDHLAPCIFIIIDWSIAFKWPLQTMVDYQSKIHLKMPSTKWWLFKIDKEIMTSLIPAMVCHRSWSPLVQLMVCGLLGNKPLPEPMVTWSAVPLTHWALEDLDATLKIQFSSLLYWLVLAELLLIRSSDEWYRTLLMISQQWFG